MCSLVSISDLSRAEILFIINDALERKKGKKIDHFPGVLASLFYESSTRTRESTECAAHRLGMHVIGFSGIEGTSVQKGEPLADTLRMYRGFGANVIALRHPLEGAARYAADILNIPVINCGDGSNLHPTQTLLDLMTIIEKRGSIDGLCIALVGDLKYGRTVHSLVAGLKMFSNITLWLVAPDSLKMPVHFIEQFPGTIHHAHDIAEADVDILYMTRIQRERFPQGPEGEFEFDKVSRIYQLTPAVLEGKRVGVMHPLPRYKHRIEISLAVDSLHNAWYIDQAENGVFLREALLSSMMLNKISRRKNEFIPGAWKELSVKNHPKDAQETVYRIDNGTLIDHIHAGKGKDVLSVLQIDATAKFVYASNISSKMHGRKDVVGFPDRELTERELSKVALVEPDATINIIRDKKVHKKGKVVLPSIIDGLVICQNPRCITYRTHNEFAPQKFQVVSHEPLLLKCYYCEVPVEREKIKLE
ncbi:aspartate carbamoyltransferase [Candidatus Woesearchaeota archaeon]|nr:aspartate carbamoyltransferase [Candidatus Woesearchaeota archaeon]